MTQPQHTPTGGYALSVKDLICELYSFTHQQLEARKDSTWSLTVGLRELAIINRHMGQNVTFSGLFQHKFTTPREVLQYAERQLFYPLLWSHE